MMMLNDELNGAISVSEDGSGENFIPLDVTEQQLSELAKSLAEAFVTNFVTNVFDARNDIIKNGEIDFQKFCEAQSDAFRVNAQAADLMAKHLLSTQTSWGVQYFTKWRDTFERLSQLAIDPVLDAKARLDLIHAELNAKLDAHFPTINGNARLRKLVPYLGTAWDFGKMGAALVNDDREEFSRSAAGFVGGELGALLGGLAIAAGLVTGWPAVRTSTTCAMHSDGMSTCSGTMRASAKAGQCPRSRSNSCAATMR